MKSTKAWTPSEMGKKGGKESVKTRLGGKTPEEISKIMTAIRMKRISELEAKIRETQEITSQRLVDMLNLSVLKASVRPLTPPCSKPSPNHQQ